MFELTEQQRQELDAPEPVAIDPQTRETYVLVRRETYDRFKALLALDDYDPDEGIGYVNEVLAEDDAKDLFLESYQKYVLAIHSPLRVAQRAALIAEGVFPP